MPRLTEDEQAYFAAMREQLADVERQNATDRREPVRLGPIEPMLATTFTGSLETLDQHEWIAEPKYDGTRLIIQHLDDQVQAYTRRGVERSDTIPDVIADLGTSLPDGCVVDGEFAFTNDAGISVFMPIHTNRDRIAARNLRAKYYIFDVLAQDNTWVMDRRLGDRYEILEDVLVETERVIRTPVAYDAFTELYDEIVATGGEGIMVKRRGSRYYPGVRSSHWRKVKAFSTADVVAVGYTAGDGDRASTFGALVMSDGSHYRGRVGTGFSREEREAILDAVVETDTRRVSVVEVGQSFTPIEPLVITVRYQEVTEHGDLRAPVYVTAWPDRSPDSISPLENR